MKNTYYITTPIYYPSGELHIGHAYTTVATDAITRYKKMRGFDTKFLTGTDEHGQKIEKAAAEAGISPKAYVDGMVAKIKTLWETLHIDYDYFTRTTDAAHVQAIQKIFTQLHDKGDIYKGEYKGLYCTPCESFITENQALEGKLCPDCKREIHEVVEEAYFFKLNQYKGTLIKHIEANPEFIMPASRRNEMLATLNDPQLPDLCVSRTSFSWGVPVPFDPKHVVYVWIDALSNYATTLGYGSNDDADFTKYWPADVHVIGKDITYFHTVIWPSILLALDLPLPKQVYAHGHILYDNRKMSKSFGNVVDPLVLIERYGIDALKYFLLREIPFGNDGNYTDDKFVGKLNSDLANDLGNLLSRTTSMIVQYFDGTLPSTQQGTAFDQTIIDLVAETATKAEAAMDALQFSEALKDIWTLISRTNKYIDETTPWVLAKDDSKQAELANVLYTLAESLRVVSILIAPVMAQTSAQIHTQLNITDPALTTWESAKTFGLLPRTVTATKGDPIFPRLDKDKEAQALKDIWRSRQVLAPETVEKPAPQGKPEITIDDFAKIEMQVGTVLACEPVKKSDKLLKSQIKIGDEVRQIVSGIADKYTPEDMIGKQVVVVTNLKPVKLRGELSQGMILAASLGDELEVVTLSKALNGGEVR